MFGNFTWENSSGGYFSLGGRHAEGLLCVVNNILKSCSRSSGKDGMFCEAVREKALRRGMNRFKEVGKFRIATW